MEYNDYELVSLAQENNEFAINILHDKYKDLIHNKAKKVYYCLKNKGLELSDVVQEAMIGFEEAINGYNQDDKALFYTFAMLCVDRQLKSLIVKHNRDKHKILNEAITLDNDDDNTLYNFLSDDVTPESEFFSKEEANDIYLKLKDSLTDFEEVVFELKVQGCSYSEITDVLDVDSKDVYNAVSRIRNKASKIIEK